MGHCHRVLGHADRSDQRQVRQDQRRRLDTLCAAAVDHECRGSTGYKARQEQRSVELLAEEKEKQRPAGRRGSDQRRHQPAQAAA
jgi:hypothetical protein